MVDLRWALRRVPPFSRSYAQVDAYAALWESANEVARLGDGPLWVVLGDSAAQGVGASAHDQGYVGQLRSLLEERDGLTWRVVNLSRSGARTRDVVDVQWPRVAEQGLAPDLVTALVGGNDAGPTPLEEWRRDVDDLTAVLPPGSVVSTVARGWKEGRVKVVNDHVRARAAGRGLRVADLWAHTGPPYRGLYADGFHPNDKGYAQWTAALAEALELG